MSKTLTLSEIAKALAHFADGSEAIELPIEAVPELLPLTNDPPKIPNNCHKAANGAYRFSVDHKSIQVEFIGNLALLSLATSTPSKGAALLTGGIIGGLLGAVLAPKKGGWIAGAVAGAAVGSLSHSAAQKDDHALPDQTEKTRTILSFKYDETTAQWIAQEKAAPTVQSNEERVFTFDQLTQDSTD